MDPSGDASFLDSEHHTRSLDRGIHLLRALAERAGAGLTLDEMAAACGVDEPEALRMLDCLLDARMVKEHQDGRRYGPGPLMFELGLALPDRARFQRRAEAVLKGFADCMGGVALLLLRSGADLVCCVREGSDPSMPAWRMGPGTRTPLFASAGGVAILQRLSPREADALLKDNIGQEIAQRGPSRLRSLERMRQQSARYGCGVNAGDVLPGLHSIGVPVYGPGNDPFAAVCLVSTPERLPLTDFIQMRDRLDRIASLLAAEACQIKL